MAVTNIHLWSNRGGGRRKEEGGKKRGIKEKGPRREREGREEDIGGGRGREGREEEEGEGKKGGIKVGEGAEGRGTLLYHVHLSLTAC